MRGSGWPATSLVTLEPALRALWDGQVLGGSESWEAGLEDQSRLGVDFCYDFSLALFDHRERETACGWAAKLHYYRIGG